LNRTQINSCLFQIYWSESGELLAICCDTNFYILKFNRDVVDKHVGDIPEEGIEDTFDVATEIQEGYDPPLPFVAPPPPPYLMSFFLLLTLRLG